MRIAIVGTGISGVTLALRLQQLGIETTLVADKTPDEMRAGRLPNTVARFEHTVARERELGVDYWSRPDYEMTCIQFRSADPLPVAFTGRTPHPVRAVDFRTLLPAFVDAYQGRGGEVVVRRPVDLPSAADGFDLVVIAVGRGSRDDLFAVDPARSPFAQPQRRLFAGMFNGLDLPEPLGLSFNLAPGVGELFQMPMWTSDGPATNILIEAVPGGPLSAVSELPPDDDTFVPMLRSLLHQYAPAIAERMRPDFSLRSPLDALQGAVTPAVRHAFAVTDDGQPALAVGDAWITNDPITGQGANVASHCAWVAADHIAGGGPFDTEWGRRVEDDMWAFAGPVTAWTNGFLQPPPPHAVGLLLAAAGDQRVADAFVAGFGDPVRLAAALSSAESTQAFIEAASGLPVGALR